MGQTRAVRTPQHRRRRRAMRRALREQAPRHHREATRRSTEPVGRAEALTDRYGRVEPEYEYAWHEWPWITVTTRDVVGPTGHRLPSARVWDAPGRMPRGSFRDMLRADPCCYCGRPTVHDPDNRHPRAGTVEHVERKADGGRGLEGNTVGACLSCNRGRHERSVLETLLMRRVGLTIDGLPVNERRRNGA